MKISAVLVGTKKTKLFLLTISVWYIASAHAGVFMTMSPRSTAVIMESVKHIYPQKTGLFVDEEATLLCVSRSNMPTCAVRIGHVSISVKNADQVVADLRATLRSSPFPEQARFVQFQGRIQITPNSNGFIETGAK